MNSSSPPSIEPRPSVARPDAAANQRPAQPADEHQRSRFENLLSRHDRCAESDDEEEASAADPSAWGLGNPSPPPLRQSNSGEGGGSGDGDADNPVQPVLDMPAPVSPGQASPDIQVPAPVFNVPMTPQANLYAYMALPIAPAGQTSRFEVLDPASSLVSHVEVNTLPQGKLTVAVGTSVQHASLMDRYLPQLQRRLADKVSATHLRVEGSDAGHAD